MGVRKDLKQAKRRTDLAARHRIELVRDERTGTVREASAAPMVAAPPRAAPPTCPTPTPPRPPTR